MPFKKHIYYLLLISLFSIVINGFSQSNFSVINYTTKNGLPQNSVRTLCFDREGFLWMATEGGLAKFNGVNFSLYNPTNTKVLSSHRIAQVFKIATDTLIVTDALGNSFSICNNQFSNVNNPNKHAINKTTSLTFTKYNSAQINAIISSSDTQLSNNAKVRSFSCGADSVFLVSKKNILCYYKNELIKEFNLSSAAYQTSFIINKQLYIITLNHALYKYNIATNKLLYIKQLQTVLNKKYNCIGYSQFPFTAAYLHNGSSIIKISEASSKELLIAPIITNFPLRVEINGIDYLQDEKLLAIGTSTNGLFIYREKQFISTTYGPNDSTNNAACFTVVPFSDSVVLSSESVLFSKSKSLGQTNINFEPLSLISDDEYNLYYYKGDNVVYHDKRTGKQQVLFSIKRPNIVSLLKHKNVLYIVDKLFLYKWQNNTPQLIVKHDLATEQNVPYKLLINPINENELFISYCGGLKKVDIAAKKIEPITTLNGKCVRAINLYKNILLISTYGNGWYALKNERLIKLPIDKNGYLNYIHTLVIDENNYLWKSTNNGLFYTSLAKIENYIADTTKPFLPYYFNEQDGILNTEFNGVSISSYAKLKNGYLVFPTMDGLLWVNPQTTYTNNSGSNIMLEAMYVDDKLVNTDQIVKSSHNKIEFVFNTSYWGIDNNLYIDYKLESLNTDWIPLNFFSRKIVFNQLAGGNYTLLIRKQTAGKNSSSSIASYSFTVQAKFTETIWFWLLIVACTLLLIYLVNKIRSRIILRQNALLKKRVDEQTKEIKQTNLALQENVKSLQLSKDSLQQSVELKDKLISIISHDVVTPLKFIAMIARVGNKQKTEIDTEHAFIEIESASQKLQDHATNILNWIKVQNNKVEVKPVVISPYSLVQGLMDTYIKLAQLKPIEFSNLINEDDIITADENILKIIINNLLSNALKYTDAGKIIATSNFTDSQYSITIADSGRGMSEEQLHYIKTATTETVLVNPNEPGSGLGFIIIQELLELINGKLAISSIQKTGTIVTIKLVQQFGVKLKSPASKPSFLKKSKSY